MNTQRAVWGLVVGGLLILGSAGSTQAQMMGGFGGFGNTAGFNALGGINQFGSPAFANPGFGVGGYGAVSNFNSMGYGYSPYGLYNASPYGYGYRSYGYGYNPYGYGVAGPMMIYTPPPVMYNQTNSLMGAIQSTTGRRTWRLGR